MRKVPEKGPDEGKPVDELAPIWTHIPSRVPRTHDEHAPISDKPATSVFNRYADLNVEETPSEEEDGESSQIKVPIEEFIRPTRKKLKKIKYLINAKMKQGAACAEGCKCEDADREEFPAIVETSQVVKRLLLLPKSPRIEDTGVFNESPGRQIPGLPEAAMSGLEGSVAKTFASTILPARSEFAVSGHKGSAARDDAKVEAKAPVRSETVMLGHKGSITEGRELRSEGHAAEVKGGEGPVSQHAASPPARNSPDSSVLHTNKSVVRPGHSSDRIKTNSTSSDRIKINSTSLSPTASSDPHKFWKTKAGQKELRRLWKEKESNPRTATSTLVLGPKTPRPRASISPLALCPLEYTKESRASLCPMSASGQEEWYEVELTADTGACDTVIPKTMCPGIPVVPSFQSINGMEYEVATGETIPNLGERRCEMWSVPA